MRSLTARVNVCETLMTIGEVIRLGWTVKTVCKNKPAVAIDNIYNMYTAYVYPHCWFLLMTDTNHQLMKLF